MKIKELIKILEKMDGELEVYKSSDDEANDIVLMDEVANDFFTDEKGEYRPEYWIGYEEYKDSFENGEDEYEGYEQVAVIF